MMIKYIIVLSLCVGVAVCDLGKEEGSECEWDGVKGKCVNAKRCLTALDTKQPPQPICSTKGDVKIICCTDCELVNDTSNVVVGPTGHVGIYWKDGRKSRDHCLQYWDELPYECKAGGFYAGIKREFNAEKKCHTYGAWGIGGAPHPGHERGAPFPHQVRLGYGDDLSKAKWFAGGSIISDRFILTAAHDVTVSQIGKLKYIAANVAKSTDPQEKWQIYTVKRIIPHPEYKQPKFYNDIALLETTEPIKFNKNVLPACLPSDEVKDDNVKTYTWRGETRKEIAETLRTFELSKVAKEACDGFYSTSTTKNLPNGIDHKTQACYGNDEYFKNACKGLSGEPIMVNDYITDCFHTIVGLVSVGKLVCGTTPDIYTKVLPYIPWIESVVWP